MPKIIDTFSAHSLKILDKNPSEFIDKFVYHLSLYNETTGETTEYNTFNAVTSYTISNLSAGTYHVTIYGEDEAGNRENAGYHQSGVPKPAG